MSEKKLFKLLDLGVGSHSGQRQKENIFTQEATPEGERTKTDEFSEKFQKGRGGQTWNLSKILHDQIFGQMIFTHKNLVDRWQLHNLNAYLSVMWSFLFW